MSKTLVLLLTLLGGFRGIVSEVIWFRMDRLQDEGRYAEIAQLATLLTQLEPKASETWSYAAWNLAYNVSVMMPTHADRWRWVSAGLRLLRDDGLRVNPGDPVLYREISWLFQSKLGGNLDEASPYYRKAWSAEIESIRAKNDWSAIAMDPKRMEKLERIYGSLDWTDPQASALYFADAGIAFAKSGTKARAELLQAVYSALMMMSLTKPEKAPFALAAMRVAYNERPSPGLKDFINRYRLKFNLK